jgi:hypothetical protein
VNPVSSDQMKGPSLFAAPEIMPSLKHACSGL